MMNHYRNLFLLTAALVVVPFAASQVGAQPPEKPAAAEADESAGGERSRLSPLMQMKLDRSKAILEGLALEDYEKISSNAQALRLLSLESGWNVIQTEEYATQSRDFRRTSAVIAEAARDRDLGRATLGYVALTVRCVECHSYMRKHQATPVPDENIGSD